MVNKVRVEAKRGNALIYNSTHPAEIVLTHEGEAIQNDIVGILKIQCNGPFCGEVLLTASDIAVLRDTGWFVKGRYSPTGLIMVSYYNE